MTTATTETRAPGRGRIVATRILAWLAAGLVVFGIVMMASFLPGAAEFGHQIHEVATIMTLVALGAGLIRTALRPAESDAAVQMLVAVPLLMTAVALVSGSFDPFVVVVLGIALLVAAVAPSSAIPSGPKDFVLLGGAVAGLALVPYALDHIQFQLNAPGTDPHVEFNHYAGMAALALSPSMLAYLASTKRSAWRLPGWMAGLVVITLGGASLAFAASSQLSTGWAVVAVAAGGLWIGLVEWTARRDAEVGEATVVG